MNQKSLDTLCGELKSEYENARSRGISQNESARKDAEFCNDCHDWLKEISAKYGLKINIKLED